MSDRDANMLDVRMQRHGFRLLDEACRAAFTCPWDTALKEELSVGAEAFVLQTLIRYIKGGCTYGKVQADAPPLKYFLRLLSRGGVHRQRPRTFKVAALQ